MSAEKTAGKTKLEALKLELADITSTDTKLGFGENFADFRSTLAQVAIYRKAEAESTITYNGKTSEEIIAEAEKFHVKTRGKLIKEGREVPPSYDDTTTVEQIEEKGLDTIISETSSGGTVNLPEMTIAEDEVVPLKDGVKLEGVSTPAGEEPRKGETVIEGALVAENNVNVSGVTLTKNALTDNSTTVSDTSITNSRILGLKPAN